MSFWKKLKLYLVRRPALKTPVKKIRYGLLRFAAFCLGPGMDEAPRILGYHGVGDGQNDLSVTVEQFEKQIDWLSKKGFRILTLRQWWSIVQDGANPPRRSVILTFDDGFKSVLTHAAPVLARHGLAATVFAVTDYAGKNNDYDRFLNAPKIPLLSWEEMKRLKVMGWDIQSHGKRHYPLFRLGTALMEEELLASKAALELELGDSVDFFCYPYGAFDPAAVSAVARAGYRAAVTCQPGILKQEKMEDWYLLPRILVDGLMSLRDFKACFRTGYRRASRLIYRVEGQASGMAEQAFDEIEKLQEEVLQNV